MNKSVLMKALPEHQVQTLMEASKQLNMKVDELIVYLLDKELQFAQWYYEESQKPRPPTNLTFTELLSNL